MFLLFEFVFCIVAVVTAFLAPNLGGTLFSGIERTLNRLARRRGWAVLSVGVTALVLRAALLCVEPIPAPQVYDEFSYLLMSDTFAHGRLANPTHPMWVHFETFHVIQHPCYASMYYPAQGVFLAVGQILLGHPFWGVWLSVGIMCAAICWMLQAWLPPFWALLGGLLAAIRLGSFSYWANSYWGGAVAAIGGALVLGSFIRIIRYCRTRDAILLGLGFIVLAASRPYEGLFFSLPVIALLVKWILNGKFRVRTCFRQVVLPLCLVVSLGGLLMLYYFWRTTGNPLLPPFFVNNRTYDPVPYFPWEKMGPVPEYHHSDMKDFYLGWWFDQYNLGRQHPVQLAALKIISFWMFFLGPLFSLPLLMSTIRLPRGIQYRDLGFRMRALIVVTLSTAMALALPVYMNLHYVAPLTGAIYFLVVLSMMWLRRWKWRSGRTGLAIVRFSVTICALLFVMKTVDRALHRPDYFGIPTWSSYSPEIPGRTKVLSDLASRPGKLLALVRYHVPADRELSIFGWVNNKADIDSSKIVWARDMGPDKNQELLDYFRGREVWLVEADEVPNRLSKYAAAAK